MPLFFVTGAPGAGKSAVAKELRVWGYAAYDTDDPERTGIAGWHEQATGRYVAGFNELEVTPELLQTHIWKLTERAWADFQRRAGHEVLFLCGRLREADEIIAVSDRTVFLKVSERDLRYRLHRRAVTDGEVTWGREGWQIDKSVEVNRDIQELYAAQGAVMIDADQSLGRVVHEVIEATARAST